MPLRRKMRSGELRDWSTARDVFQCETLVQTSVTQNAETITHRACLQHVLRSRNPAPKKADLEQTACDQQPAPLTQVAQRVFKAQMRSCLTADVLKHLMQADRCMTAPGEPDVVVA